MKQSKLAIGSVRHRRFLGKKNQFRYKAFMVLLDLSETEYVFNNFWFWSTNRLNVATFYRKNFLGSDNENLLQSVNEMLAQHDKSKVETVFLLTNLSYYGYSINPISVYFCIQDSTVIHVILEVTNTPWGETKHYVLTPEKLKDDVYRVNFDKQLHVSPFLSMDYLYKLRFKYNQEGVMLHLENWQEDQCHFDATLSLKFRSMSHKNMATVLLCYPFMTLKVALGIYWQALKVWLKGNKYIPHP